MCDNSRSVLHWSTGRRVRHVDDKLLIATKVTCGNFEDAISCDDSEPAVQIYITSQLSHSHSTRHLIGSTVLRSLNTLRGSETALKHSSKAPESQIKSSAPARTRDGSMIFWNSGCNALRPSRIPFHARRWLSTSALERRLSQPVQSYISTSHDPYLNLSIEHYLLQKASADSAILLLYVNRPSIIIGRNQNPWLEVNLALLDQAREKPETEPPGLGTVDLVRRRSGGGTVFHDEGNVNWTVISPSANFTRDKHAEMIVRALRKCIVERARVNERHDIVLDQGERGPDTDPVDTHVTPFTSTDNDGPRPLKVSGSAYKLTRGRALHHGTCLLTSPNLNVIPHYLHSPAKPYITARGVESVSSPVSNILLGNEEFFSSVQDQFARLYSESSSSQPDEVGEELLEIDEIKSGYQELKSLEWKYLQTPQFTISNAADEARPVDVNLTVRHGVITEASIRARPSTASMPPKAILGDSLRGHKLHEIISWDDAFSADSETMQNAEHAYLIDWLQNNIPHITE